MAQSTTRFAHRPALDGVRAFAVAAVLVYHGGVAAVPGGFLGVDAFFVLSGFLITSLLLEEHARTGRVSLRAFYARRARRLLPALGAVLVFAATVYVGFGASLRQLVPVVFYVANWPRAAGHEIGLMNHTWSLAIEEQFYIVWPLVLIVGLRWARRWLLAATVAAAAGSVALRFLLADGGVREDRVWFGTDTNAFALLAGCALALWMANRRTGQNRTGIATAAGAVLVAAGAWSSTTGYTFVVPLVAAAAGVIMIAALCQSGPVGVFGAGWLRYAGRRSYAWYLWHVPLLIVLRLAFDVDSATAGVATLVSTVILGELSWRLVERPALRGGLLQRLNVRPVPPADAREGLDLRAVPPAHARERLDGAAVPPA